ncbi:MAG TPA: hypothetical protein VGO93_27430 [Candidatus Xenobia bacterium]
MAASLSAWSVPSTTPAISPETLDMAQTVARLRCPRCQQMLGDNVKFCATGQLIQIEHQPSPPLRLVSQELFDTHGNLVASSSYGSPPLQYRNHYEKAVLTSQDVVGSDGLTVDHWDLDVAHHDTGDTTWEWTSTKSHRREVISAVKGHLSEQDDYDGMILREARSYDPQGYLERSETHDGQGLPLAVTVYRHEDDRIVAEQMSLHDKLTTTTIVDAHHLPQTRTTANASGLDIIEQRYQFIYDAEGNWVVRRVMQGGGLRQVEVTVRRLKYFHPRTPTVNSMLPLVLGCTDPEGSGR